jgi:hypothetical protein
MRDHMRYIQDYIRRFEEAEAMRVGCFRAGSSL